MTFPKDPVMLLSVVNTYLRDHHTSLEDLCKSNNIAREELLKYKKTLFGKWVRR